MGRNSNIKNLRILDIDKGKLKKEYYTVKQASNKSSFNPQTIRGWIRSGKIIGYTVNNVIYLKKSDNLPPNRIFY